MPGSDRHPDVLARMERKADVSNRPKFRTGTHVSNACPVTGALMDCARERNRGPGDWVLRPRITERSRRGLEP